MHKKMPMKRFGQNYLTDKNIINKIINEFNPSPTDNIIEIGPGYGSITEILLNINKELTAIEIDRQLAEELRLKFPGLNLINDDFLKFDLNRIVRTKGDKIRLIGNIPYNISSPIIFKFIENRLLIKDTVITVQYEVAKRLRAKRGTKDYGILSVILNYFANVRHCFKVSPNVFYPKPKVFSAIVHISFRDNLPNLFEDRLFIESVKACFGNRRKTLKNSLSNSIFKDINFSALELDLSKRAEELEIEDFIKLTNFIRRHEDG